MTLRALCELLDDNMELLDACTGLYNVADLLCGIQLSLGALYM